MNIESIFEWQYDWGIYIIFGDISFAIDSIYRSFSCLQFFLFILNSLSNI